MFSWRRSFHRYPPVAGILQVNFDNKMKKPDLLSGRAEFWFHELLGGASLASPKIRAPWNSALRTKLFTNYGIITDCPAETGRGRARRRRPSVDLPRRNTPSHSTGRRRR